MIFGRDHPDGPGFTLDLDRAFSQHDAICHDIHFWIGLDFDFAGTIALDFFVGRKAFDSDLGIIGQHIRFC